MLDLVVLGYIPGTYIQLSYELIALSIALIGMLIIYIPKFNEFKKEIATRRAQVALLQHTI